MLSFQVLIVTGSAALFVMAPSFAHVPARVRGTITAIKDSVLIVKERDGRSYTLKTGSYTTYANVVPSALDAIKVNDFVGSAVKGPPNAMVAVELAIIPGDMRAGRISLYRWDPLPDPAARHRSDTTRTGRRNVPSSAPDLIDTKMTNGIVSAATGNEDGLTLTVTSDSHSKSFRIIVPPNAPIVRYMLSDRSAIALGSAVMIKTNPGGRAGLVTVGKGITPPM